MTIQGSTEIGYMKDLDCKNIEINQEMWGMGILSDSLAGNGQGVELKGAE